VPQKRLVASVAAFMIWGGFVLPASSAVAAAPKLTQLFPAGVARGATATVHAAGEFSQWPPQVWYSSPGLTFAAETEKGKWKVSAAPEAPIGTAWIRFYDAEGATGLRPFLVGLLPEVEEQEPNDTPKQLVAISLPVTINGKLVKGGDVDGYLVELKAGQTLVAAVQANIGLGSPMDGVLQLARRNDRGELYVVQQSEDNWGLDPRLVYTVPQDGVYAVRLFAFPAGTDANVGFAGADSFVYRLSMTVGEYIDYPWPLAATRGAAAAVQLIGWNLAAEHRDTGLERLVSNPIEPTTVFSVVPARISLPAPSLVQEIGVVDSPVMILAEEQEKERNESALGLPLVACGRIKNPGDTDSIRFLATKGKAVRWRLDSAVLGFPLDGHLSIYDPQGKLLAENDDSAAGRDPELTFSPTEDGTLLVKVGDVFEHGGPRHAYRLVGYEVQPDFVLTVPSDAISVAPGQSTELVVTVERRDGFNQPIEMRCEGLPAGVTAAAAVSQPEGDSAKTVKIVIQAEATTAAGAAPLVPFRLTGTGGEPSRTRKAEFVMSNPSYRNADLWLTIK